jgi:CRISPR-associated protein Cas1
MQDLHVLPRFRDGLSFLYVDRVRIEQDQQAIVLMDDRGRVPVPIASLSVLMLGPGSTITHAAMVALADNGCSIAWCGEGSVRCYAAGGGETHRAANLMAQAKAWADPTEHMNVVKRLYRMRFPDELRSDLTLEQLRGMEGVRVREMYARMGRETGVKWSGRTYKRGDWGAADPVNRALSTANACLYGLCHAAIVATGFSTGLGFIHTGKMLAFVYDVADLYKCDVTVPVAFEAARDGWTTGVEARVRKMCRQRLWEGKVLDRIVPDIQSAIGLKPERVQVTSMSKPETFETSADSVTGLWSPDGKEVAGGQNYADDMGAEEVAGSIPPADDEEGIPF